MDSPLSATGQHQAEAVARVLSEVPFAAVYASPQTRAIETARRIAEPHRLAVTPMAGLRELRQGVWEGLQLPELEQRYGTLLRQWWADPVSVRVPSGEMITEMRDRAVAAVRAIVAQHPGKMIAAVAHGGVNKTILLTLLGAPLTSYWRLRQSNVCINVLEFDGSATRVLTVNYTGHVAG